MRRGKALIQSGGANIGRELRAVDAVNARECLATLKCQSAPRDFISVVNQPFLRDALTGDEAHKEGLANGVRGVKDCVNVGDRHRRRGRQLNHCRLIYQRQSENIALELIDRVSRKRPSAQDEWCATPRQPPGLVIGAARQPLKLHCLLAGDFPGEVFG